MASSIGIRPIRPSSVTAKKPQHFSSEEEEKEHFASLSLKDKVNYALSHPKFRQRPGDAYGIPIILAKRILKGADLRLVAVDKNNVLESDGLVAFSSKKKGVPTSTMNRISASSMYAILEQKHINATGEKKEGSTEPQQQQHQTEEQVEPEQAAKSFLLDLRPLMPDGWIPNADADTLARELPSYYDLFLSWKEYEQQKALEKAEEESRKKAEEEEKERLKLLRLQEEKRKKEEREHQAELSEANRRLKRKREEKKTNDILEADRIIKEYDNQGKASLLTTVVENLKDAKKVLNHPITPIIVGIAQYHSEWNFTNLSRWVEELDARSAVVANVGKMTTLSKNHVDEIAQPPEKHKKQEVVVDAQISKQQRQEPEKKPEQQAPQQLIPYPGIAALLTPTAKFTASKDAPVGTESEQPRQEPLYPVIPLPAAPAPAVIEKLVVSVVEKITTETQKMDEESVTVDVENLDEMC